MTVENAPGWNAANSLVQSLADCGIDTVFGNPGTTEMPLVAALDDCGRPIKAVLALHENVCSAAADGFWRTTGRPAATLLHLGPGLTNAAANLHNARRARSGLVNIIGEHPSRHLGVDSPLQMPLETLCRALSDWTGYASDPYGQAQATRQAATIASNGKLATLIVPHDVQLSPCSPVTAQPWLMPKRPLSRAKDDVIASLGRAKRPALLVGGTALDAESLQLAAQVADRCGAAFYVETLFATMDRGGDLPEPMRLPYFPEQAVALLAGHDLLLLVGASEPVAFFAYPSVPSRLVPASCTVVSVAMPEEDAATALMALLDHFAGSHAKPTGFSGKPAGEPAAASTGPLTPQSLCAAVASRIPEGGVVVEEGVTTGLAFYGASANAKRFRHLGLTGGAIGWGPGASVGAALGSGGPIINLQSDGSGLYLPQALWTQARHSLPVTTVICRNSRYRILELELSRAGTTHPGPNASLMCDIDGMDWPSIARGFGVEAVAVQTVDALLSALDRAIASQGPYLIEAWI
jgi:acetolactate synthase-1/2/3 large subunit